MRLRNILAVVAGAAIVIQGSRLIKRARRRKQQPLASSVRHMMEGLSRVFKVIDGRVAKVPDLQYLVDNESFIVASLMPAGSFVQFCKQRGLETSLEQLAKFEELGIFLPIARAKVETPQVVAWFWREQIRFLFEANLLWQPRAGTPSHEKLYSVKDEGKGVDTFYSKFQIYPLHILLKTFVNATVKPEDWLTFDKASANKLLKWASRSSDRITSEYRIRSTADLIAGVCQVVSNRYYPPARTDRRTIRVPAEEIGWDWYEYRRRWNPVAVLSDIGIDERTLGGLRLSLLREAQQLDPIGEWRELVNFISLDKRGKLKGAALLAQTLYSMEQMLTMFLSDLPAGKEHLYRLSVDSLDDIYGEGVTQNPLRYLEYLVNEYHLNPRPRMILVVEGDGEYVHVPKLVEEVFGLTFPQLGIEIRRLAGVGEFEGNKSIDKYGALEKYIDSHHDKHTLVFVILDKESRVEKVKVSLVKKQSHFYKRRTVTRDEYVHLWESSIERANFTNGEIAQALTEFCNSDHTFTAEEVEEAYGSGEGNPLDGLLSSKTEGRYQLNKVDLLGLLFKLITSSSKEEYEDKWSKRPLLKTLSKAVLLAQHNHQPQYEDAKKEIQESGFFGHVSGVKEEETKKLIANL